MAITDLLSSLTTKTTGNKRVAGIDIGTSSIKVVELQEKNEILTLMTYGELQLGPYDGSKPVGQTVVLDPEVEREAFVDVLRESAVKASGAVFAMPLSSSFVTIMTLTADPKEDVSSKVRLEARKYIPVPISEVTLDWAEVDTRDVVSKNARDILLVSIQNESLERFNKLLRSVNLINPPTEIECFSAIRSVYSEKEKDVAIIDFGAQSTKLYLVRGGLLQRMYRVTSGGKFVTDRIAKELELPFEEAELLKRSVKRGDPKFEAVQKIYRGAYDRILKEFRQVIEDYEARVGTEIKFVHLMGGASVFPGVDMQVSDYLNRQANLVHPFDKVAYPAFMEDTMIEIGPNFAVAMGAALRAFE